MILNVLSEVNLKWPMGVKLPIPDLFCYQDVYLCVTVVVGEDV